MVQIMYFAHPVNVYNTPLEEKLMGAIQKAFPDWQIENPNQPKHQEGYKRAGMNYYFNEVLPSIDGAIGLSFPDGRIGAGVFGEEESVFKRTGNLWTIDYRKFIARVLDIEMLRPFALTPEQTRPRIYIDGKRENGIRGFFD